MLNKQKTLLVFATEMEATATRSNPLLQNFDICITGMGPAAVKNILTEAIGGYDMIINAGVVGSMRDDITIGHVVPIRQVSYQPANHTIELEAAGLSLLTVDAPCYEKNSLFDLVDMEGYMVALLCQQANIPLRFVKIVSDIVSVHSSKHIKERLPELSLLLSKHISYNFEFFFNLDKR